MNDVKVHSTEAVFHLDDFVHRRLRQVGQTKFIRLLPTWGVTVTGRHLRSSPGSRGSSLELILDSTRGRPGAGSSVGVPQVLLRVLRHEVGGRVGLQVAGDARPTAVVRGGRPRHSPHSPHTSNSANTAAGVTKKKLIYGNRYPRCGSL